MVLTMAAVAANKGIRLEHLGATVKGRTEFPGREAVTHFATHLEFQGNLTPREQHILYNSARNCEVHKMLRGKITFEEILEHPPQ
jgi:uncharacterized OsmC-like protein